MTFAIDLRDKVVLLTGGSSGIGAATVRGLHAAGAAVYFTYVRHEERAHALAAELRERVAFCRCDVGDHTALPGLVERCLDQFKRVHVLVNNAAIFAENAFEQTDYARWRAGWQRTFDVNLFGAAHLAWLVMQQMRRQGNGGRIVNVASRAGHRGELTFADYGASKAALINFTKSIARACAKDGITALAIAPGFIDTEMAGPDLATRRAQIESEIPLGYIAAPHAVADVVVFAASPLATYANGTTIDVNGGSYVR